MERINELHANLVQATRQVSRHHKLANEARRNARTESGFDGSEKIETVEEIRDREQSEQLRSEIAQQRTEEYHFYLLEARRAQNLYNRAIQEQKDRRQKLRDLRLSNSFEEFGF